MKCSYVAISEQSLKKKVSPLKRWWKDKTIQRSRCVEHRVSANFAPSCTQYFQEISNKW